MKYIILCMLMLGFPALVGAQDVVDDKQPIEITADSGLEWDRDAKVFTAKGNAKIIQGATQLTADLLVANYNDDGDAVMLRTVTATGGRPNVDTGDEVLTSDKMVANFMDDDSGAIDTIIATGDVEIIAKNDVLKGDKAEYHPVDQLAVVTGNVTITRGSNVLSGNRATFDMKTNTSKMESDNKGRVKAVFYPKSGGGNDD